MENNNDKSVNENESLDELKSLPKIKLSPEFDSELSKKIRRIRAEVETQNAFPILLHPKAIIATASVALCLCIVLLIFITTRFTVHNDVFTESKIYDSSYYDGKKIIILPPKSSEPQTQASQKGFSEVVKPDQSTDVRSFEKYLERSDEAVKSIPDTTLVAPSMAKKPKIDSLAKNKFLKKAKKERKIEKGK